MAGADSRRGLVTPDHFQDNGRLFLVGPDLAVHTTRFLSKWPDYSLFNSPVETGCIPLIRLNGNY